MNKFNIKMTNCLGINKFVANNNYTSGLCSFIYNVYCKYKIYIVVLIIIIIILNQRKLLKQ